MEEDPRPVRNEVPLPDVPRPDPGQMQAQLTTLTELVRGLMTVVERLVGRNSMPPLEDAPRPLGPAMAGNPMLKQLLGVPIQQSLPLVELDIDPGSDVSEGKPLPLSLLLGLDLELKPESLLPSTTSGLALVMICISIPWLGQLEERIFILEPTLVLRGAWDTHDQEHLIDTQDVWGGVTPIQTVLIALHPSSETVVSLQKRDVQVEVHRLLGLKDVVTKAV
ncbi:hypothetical protein L484_016583 [Morus notabilis]|uniref:Uncharacterized protein n=1 Tax=Morus notabilis TaxID=981085 RepID=W9QKF7_9ROSA|nr:hypothetical protein L484_016583 [Morus notabilis]